MTQISYASCGGEMKTEMNKKSALHIDHKKLIKSGLYIKSREIELGYTRPPAK
jgi:hypothetical protein